MLPNRRLSKSYGFHVGTSAICAGQMDMIKRVLVVEDDDLFRKSVCGFVSAMGYDPIPAESAEQALGQSSNGLIDLILTDFQLGKMNGIDLIVELRRSGINVPTILMSGFLSDDVRQRATDISVSAIIRKPTDLGKLQDLLPNLLGEMV